MTENTHLDGAAAAATEEWLVTVNEHDFQARKVERISNAPGGTREFVVTVDKSAQIPLKIQAREAAGNRDLTPEEYGGFAMAYTTALAASGYVQMWMDAWQYWQVYYAGMAEAASQVAAFSPDELAYYQQIAIGA